MSVIATAMKHLMAAGVQGEALLAAVAELEAEMLARPVPVQQTAAAARQARYRQRGGGQVPPETRAEIFARDNYTCLECAAVDALEIDHIIPLNKGGHPTDPENLQTLCRSCNARKRDRIRKADIRGKSRTFEDSANVQLDPSPLSPPSDKETSPTPPKEINSPLNPPTPETGERAGEPAAEPDAGDGDDDDREDGETKIARKLPRDWQPVPFGPKTEAGGIVSSWDDDRFRREVEKFTSHHRARGNTMKNWQRAWQTWVGNTVDFGRNGNGRQSGNSGAGEFQELARLAAGAGRPRRDQDLLDYGLLGNAEGFR